MLVYLRDITDNNSRSLALEQAVIPHRCCRTNNHITRHALNDKMNEARGRTYVTVSGLSTLASPWKQSMFYLLTWFLAYICSVFGVNKCGVGAPLFKDAIAVFVQSPAHRNLPTSLECLGLVPVR